MYRDLITDTERPIKRSLYCSYRTVSINRVDIFKWLPSNTALIGAALQTVLRQKRKIAIIAHMYEKWVVLWDTNTPSLISG